MQPSSNVKEKGLLARFGQYQRERFPFLGHGVLIAAFTFSVISFSRIIRGEVGFISFPYFLLAWGSCLGLFFLLRVTDEHKDAADDRAYRPELPVPRGLISLRELRLIAIPSLVILLGLNALFAPNIFYCLLLAITYLGLMTKEFFVAEWLKKRQLVYVFSHMLIIPLIDLYASSFDWGMSHQAAPPGLWWFFAISFMNGIVLEFGRKIRVPADEQTGVQTYSARYGFRKATYLWLIALGLTWLICLAAITYTGYQWPAYVLHTSYLIISSVIGLLFLRKPTPKRAKAVEHASGLWTLLMYLTLGGFPMLISWIS